MKTIDDCLSKATSKQKELYYALEKGIKEFSSFPIIGNKSCISYKGGGKKNIWPLHLKIKATLQSLSTSCQVIFLIPKAWLKNIMPMGDTVGLSLVKTTSLKIF